MRNLLVGSLMGLALSACTSSTPDAGNSVRMPYNQQVFFLDNEGNNSYLYEVDYDFQGLTGDAVLTPRAVLEGRSHMAISPNKKWVVVINNAGQGRIHLISTERPELGPITITLKSPKKNNKWKTGLALTQADFDEAGRLFLAGNNGVFLVSLDPTVYPEAEVGEDGTFTNVNAFTAQFDAMIDSVEGLSEEDAKAAIAAYSFDGFEAPATADGPAIAMSATPDAVCDTDDCDAVQGGFDLGVEVFAFEIEKRNCSVEYRRELDACDTDESVEDIEACKDDALVAKQECKADGELSKFKFKGGDLLFTQGSSETEGMETESAISLTRFKHMAAKIELVYETEAREKILGAKFQKLFDLRKHVTGGAIMGDDHIIASFSNADDFVLYDMDGNILAEPKMCVKLPVGEETAADGWLETVWDKTLMDAMDFTATGDAVENACDGEDSAFARRPGSAFHKAGDLASTQSFDTRNGYHLETSAERRIEGERSYLLDASAELAEVALYRPASDVENAYIVDDADMPDIDDVARRNAANGDIADLRRNARKFTSLGKGGMMLLNFDSEMTLSAGSVLDVMETSWNRAESYEDPESAMASYHEKATVWVWDKGEDAEQPSSIAAFLDNGDFSLDNKPADSTGEWVELGNAYIALSRFDIGGLGLESAQWILIEDGVDGDNSKTPDGFDVNYVALSDDDNAFCDFPLDTEDLFLNADESTRCELNVEWGQNYENAGGMEFWYELAAAGTAEKNYWGRHYVSFDGGYVSDTDLAFRESLPDGADVAEWATSYSQTEGDDGTRRIMVRTKCTPDSWKMSEWVEVEVQLADTCESDLAGGTLPDMDG